MIVLDPRSHGGNHCRLRPRRRRPHRRQHEASARQILQYVHGLNAPVLRDLSRLDRVGGGICHRNCRRHGRASVHATVPDICGHGIDTYLWGGAWAIRVSNAEKRDEMTG